MREPSVGLKAGIKKLHEVSEEFGLPVVAVLWDPGDDESSFGCTIVVSSIAGRFDGLCNQPHSDTDRRTVYVAITDAVEILNVNLAHEASA